MSLGVAESSPRLYRTPSMGHSHQSASTIGTNSNAGSATNLASGSLPKATSLPVRAPAPRSRPKSGDHSRRDVRDDHLSEKGTPRREKLLPLAPMGSGRRLPVAASTSLDFLLDIRC